MDWKLELVAVPVSDVDRAIASYADQVGFHLDHDHLVSSQIRFVQLTPPGSACSDVEAAREQLAGHGVAVSEVRQFDWGKREPLVRAATPDAVAWLLE